MGDYYEAFINKQSRFEALVKNSSDIIAIIDEQGMIIYESPAFELILGYNPKEVVGVNALSFVHPDDLETANQKLSEVITNRDDVVRFELRLRTINEEWLDFELIASNHLHDRNINGIIVNYRDITENKKIKAELYNLAYYDSLTQLPNRKNFNEILKMSLAEAEKTSQLLVIMIFDLDGFKFVNEFVGDEIGDELLKQIVIKVKAMLGDDAVLARLSSDEFAILFKQIKSKSEVDELGYKVKDIFKEVFIIEGYELNVTASIGISIYPYSGDDRVTLMKKADLAVTLAKRNGKNNFQLYDESLTLNSDRAYFLRNELRKAIINNEFILHYQPRVNANTNEIIAAEALIRWEHPRLGLISPSEFIPIAEETGWIIPLGEWVFKTVCEQQRNWMQSGLVPIKISLNFSVLQLLQKDLIKNIKKILLDTKQDPHLIEIEITESLFLDENIIILENLKTIREMGIHIAIDDFGTGYSSFSSLQKYEVDTIKIDRSFLKEIPEKNEWKEIVKAILMLAHGLKMNIVAEGVELKQQLRFLQSLDCHEVQGYYFSKPIDTLQFKNLLRQKVIVPEKN